MISIINSQDMLYVDNMTQKEILYCNENNYHLNIPLISNNKRKTFSIKRKNKLYYKFR